MIGLLLACYPARWRARYEEEFRAVLESRPIGPFDVADVLIGALDARLAPRRLTAAADTHGGHLVMLRIGGIGAIAGGLLWFIGLAGLSGVVGDDAAWGPVVAIGNVGLLLALIGLSAFQAQRDPVLVWAAFVLPAIGTLASVIGVTAMTVWPGDGTLLLGSVSPWSIWFVGLVATLIGSTVFAIATIRAAVFSRRAAQALGISSALVLIIMFGAFSLDNEALGAQALFATVLGAFAASWVALGVMAIRRGPIRAVAPA
jgi:hypothetical protein